MSARPLPEIGTIVRRVDSGQMGTVVYIAKEGDWLPMMMRVGDVEVGMQSWRSVVTSGSIFWEKWAPVLAQEVVTEGISQW